jgi:hypothetical protein
MNTVASKNSGVTKRILLLAAFLNDKADLQKEIPEVDLFFGTEDYEKLLKNLVVN